MLDTYPVISPSKLQDIYIYIPTIPQLWLVSVGDMPLYPHFCCLSLFPHDIRFTIPIRTILNLHCCWLVNSHINTTTQDIMGIGYSLWCERRDFQFSGARRIAEWRLDAGANGMPTTVSAQGTCFRWLGNDSLQRNGTTLVLLLYAQFLYVYIYMMCINI